MPYRNESGKAMKEIYWYKATVAFRGRKDKIGGEGVTLGYAMGHGRRDDHDGSNREAPTLGS